MTARILAAALLIVLESSSARAQSTPYDAAIARYEANDLAGALSEIARVEKARPTDGTARYYRGIFLEKRGDAAGAERAYREAIKLSPDLPEARSNLCALRLAAKEPGEAMPLCEKAVALRADYAEGWFNLGLAYRASGRDADAERAFGRVTTLSPDKADGWTNLGVLRLARGDDKGAVAAFRQATARAPRDATAQLNLGLALSASGDLDGASLALSQTVRIAPTDAVAWQRLGSVERRRRKPDAAVTALEKAASLSSKDAGVLLELALSLASREKPGDTDRAIQTLGRAETLAPKAWEPPFYLGILHAQSGRCAEAKKAFARYRARDPKARRAEQAETALAACQ